MAAEEEIEAELEAMEAVYGTECVVLQRLPPELRFMLTPYTAEDTSVQFVEAVLVVRAGEQYPSVAPELELSDVKGLDERRHAKLLSQLRAQVAELSGGPSLLTLCEAAKDLLTSMNFPDGDCCFCRFPLMMEGVSGPRPFFNLKSCFHCFHSDCFGGWWKWLHDQKETKGQLPENAQMVEGAGHVSSHGNLENSKCILCPVCRTVLLPDDVSHVVSTPADQHSADEGKESEVLIPLVMSQKEMTRRAYFASQFEAQKARGGIIELKRLDVIQPGMVLASAVPSSLPVDNGISKALACGRRKWLEKGQAEPSDSFSGETDVKTSRGRSQNQKSKPPMQGRKQWEKRSLRKQSVVHGLHRGMDEATRSDAPFPTSRRVG